VVPTGVSLHRLRQVHGATVVVVGPSAAGRFSLWATDAEGRPPEADAVVTAATGACLAVLTADCAALALGSPDGVHAAVHVGWRGLTTGVIAQALEAMTALGARSVVAGLGPTIHPCCYEFGTSDLDAVARVVGDDVRAVTSAGAAALDLPAGVRAVLRGLGIPLVVDLDRCTACGDDAFSHRRRGDDARQALFVWRDDAGPAT
jgi:YfiH family protein